MMEHFKKVVVGDKVFGLVQGPLIVTDVVPKKSRLEGFCAITAVNPDGKMFHYTMDGLPGWALGHCNCQTLYYQSEIDLSEIDLSPTSKVLSIKKVKRLVEDERADIRCPSGIWMDTTEVPEMLVDKALKKGQNHLFREAK